MTERQLLALMAAIVYGTAQPEDYEHVVTVARRILDIIDSGKGEPSGEEET